MVSSARVDLFTDPTGTLDALRKLGVDRLHVPLYWDNVAPDPAATHKPDFDAANPSAYPAAGWAIYDTLVKGLKARGMGIDLAIVPPSPRWASGPGAPHPATQTEWRPDAAAFGDLVRAVATRYSGHYIPPGQSKPLPRVDFWSIWNEPNIGSNLAPEVNPHTQVESAPQQYRGLVDAAWTAFAATGHEHDTILIGEMAPAGVHQGVGLFNSMPPLRFLRALYCVGSDYKPLTGAAARVRDCPTTAAASKRFAADNPGLFKASGFANHPYPQGLPPNTVTPDEPDFTELAATGRLEHALDTMNRAYGSSTRFPIWSTEFGYSTTPPDTQAGTVSPTTAAKYLNWAEYLTWLDSRQRSFDQYLLRDPVSSTYATGLETNAGVPKPGYYAFRMPIFLPATATKRHHPLVIWGGVRPAPDAAQQTHRTQSVQIQFKSSSGGAYRTTKTVSLTGPHGYFEVTDTFPGSGTVRSAWRAPDGTQIYSRTVPVTVS